MTGTRAQPPAICRQRGFVGVSRWQISTNPHPLPTAACHLPPCLSALVGWGCLTSRHEQSGLHRRRLTALEARNPNSSLWRLTPAWASERLPGPLLGWQRKVSRCVHSTFPRLWLRTQTSLS